MNKYNPTFNPTRALLLAIPFYKNLGHVDYVRKTLVSNYEFLKNINAKILFLNDSLNYEGLRESLVALGGEFDLEIEYIENEENIGFIKTINKAISISIKENCDLLIINSDTLIFQGAIEEMQVVAYLDPMIGFVCPRSNNASLATFPHGLVDKNIDPDVGFSAYSKVNKILPRYTYVPTAVGFCLMIKYQILSDFGLLDEIYGMGYCEENDLIMRANRYGFRAVLANHAYAWHKGSDSFIKLDKDFKIFKNSNNLILEERYPEYKNLVDSYFSGPNYIAEDLVAQLIPNENNRIVIGFDFSIFGPYHNGTFELGKKILAAAVHHWSDTFQIAVFVNNEALLFHELGKYANVIFYEPSENKKCAVIIRTNQIFLEEDIVKLYKRAPIVYVFMLDTIAIDCGYLNVGLNKALWSFVSKWTDVVFAISEYSYFQYTTRFKVSPFVKVISLLPSIDVAEYQSSLESVSSINSDRKKVFIVGNKFEHKAVIPTVNKLAGRFPEMDFTVLVGRSDFSSFSNVKYLQNNTMTDNEISSLYAHSDAIVFPSYYEGFGFPVLHGLSNKTPVFLRKINSSLEIVNQIKNTSDNTYFFETLDELVSLLSKGIPIWTGEGPMGEKDGWKRVVLGLESNIRASLNEIKFDFIVERLEWLEESFGQQINNALKVKNLNKTISNLEEINFELKNKSNKIKIIEIIQSLIGRNATLVILRLIPNFLK